MDDKASESRLDSDLRDRPELQCGEIVITPEMVEAGVSILSLSAVGGGPSDGGQEVAEDVFVAMLEASVAFRHGRLSVRPSWRRP